MQSVYSLDLDRKTPANVESSAGGNVGKGTGVEASTEQGMHGPPLYRSSVFGAAPSSKGKPDYNAELDKAANDHADASTHAPVLSVTNVNDYASAQNLLTRIEGYRPLMDQAITQSTGAMPLGLANLPAGVNETSKVRTAKQTNEDLINDLHVYLAAAGGQAIATGSFQMLYGEALRSFYKLDGIMLHLNGSSLDTGNAKESNLGVSADKLASMEVLGAFGPKSNAADQVSSIAKADPAGIGNLRTEVKALSKSMRGSLLTNLETKERDSVLKSKEVRVALLRADGALAAVKANKLSAQIAAAQSKVSVAGAMATALMGHIAGVGKAVAGKSTEGLQLGDFKNAFNDNGPAPELQGKQLPQILGPELVNPMAPSSSNGGGGATAGGPASSGGPYLAGGLAAVATLDPKAAAMTVLASLIDPLQKELAAFSAACGACAGAFPDNTAVLAESDEQIARAKMATASLIEVPLREAAFKNSMAGYLGAVEAFTEARELYKAKMAALGAALDQKTGGTSKNGTKSPFTRMLKLITEGELFVVQADAAIRVGEAELADKPKTSANDAHAALMNVNGVNNTGRPYYEPVVSTMTTVDNTSGTPKIVDKKDESGQTITRVRVQLQTAKNSAQASDSGVGSAEDGDGQPGATTMSRKARSELQTMRTRVNNYIAKLKAATIGE